MDSEKNVVTSENTQEVKVEPTTPEKVRQFRKNNRFLGAGSKETPLRENEVGFTSRFSVEVDLEESRSGNPEAVKKITKSIDDVKTSLLNTAASAKRFTQKATPVISTRSVLDKINRHQARTRYIEEIDEEELVDVVEYEEIEEEEEVTEDEVSESEEIDDSADASDTSSNNNKKKKDQSSKKKKKPKKKAPNNAATKKASQNASKKAAQTATKKAAKNAGKKAAAKAAGKVASKGAGKALGALFVKFWWVFAIIAVVLLLIILLIIILGGAGAASEYANNSYLDPEYDYNKTVVILTNSYTDESQSVEIEQLMIDDLVKGAVYAEFKDDISSLNEDQIKELFKTYLIVAKTLALSVGNYNNETKEIILQSGAKGLPYCDIDNGCKVIESNGTYTYVSANYAGKIDGTEVQTISPMDYNIKGILDSAYADVEYKILTPKDFDELLKTYTFGNVAYTQDIKTGWITSAISGEKYEKIISSTPEYKNWKIYDIRDYALVYTPSSSDSYWWPIGSAEAENGIYSGKPTATYVSSTFGWRQIQGKTSNHQGIDIGAACEKNVIIAAKDGQVITAKDGCPSYGSYGNSCGGGYGNHVIVQHDDGSITAYAHMFNGSVAVQVGDRVMQGQKLGLVGSSGSSTGCHLHFEIRMNGAKVNPLDYVNPNNPRPAGIKGSYLQGGDNMQTVCLSLKSSGFSDNAVAGILTNIQAESSFNPTALGDNGTSYGLCQWHNGRYSRLKSFCSDKYSTINCQLSYLLDELQKSYIGVYNYLLSDNNAYAIAEYYCLNFEIPANRQVTCSTRASNYADRFLTYVKNGCN